LVFWQDARKWEELGRAPLTAPRNSFPFALIFKNPKSICRLRPGTRAVFALALVAAMSVPSFSQDGDSGSGTVNLDIQADFSDYDRNLGIAKASGNVLVKYGDVTIRAGQIEFHQSSGKIFARDGVRLFKDGQVIDAEEIIYNIHTREITTSQLKSALESVFFSTETLERSEEIEGAGGGPIILHDSYFTTHDSASPDYHIKVKKLEIHPNDKIVMHGARVHVQDTPVLWFPYFVQPLDADLGYYFIPGWNSAWGGYVLNRYGFMVGENHHAHAHFDYRSERGAAGGVELFDRKFRNNENIGRLKLYYADDQNPDLSYNGVERNDGTANERYRINFQHRIYVPGSDDETFYLDFDINRYSDAFFYEDFFPSEFRDDPRPDNLINLTKLFERGEISLTGRFQLNEFFQTDTRTPELAIDIIRTPIGDTGFFYDGLTSYGVIDEDLDDATLLLPGTVDPNGYNRFHTYHELLYPTRLGFLDVVPKAGVGYTNYSSFDFPGFNSVDRTTLHAGIDLSFKMSKRSPDVVNHALGLDGLLHVVRPYLSYSMVSTDDLTGRLSPIDRLTPSTRLRPIDMPLFTAIDDIRNWQIVRAGISNRWYTRRDGATYEWLSLNNYFDIYLDDPEFARDFSNFFTELKWRPVPWITAATTAQVPFLDDTFDFTEIHSTLSFIPTDWFQISLGHYFINGHPFFGDTDLHTLATYTRLSDNWGFSTQHRFEADDSTLEYQQYTLHRDLGSWTASLGGIVRDNRTGEDEYGVVLGLTLKAFPRLSLPVDFQPGSLSSED